MRSRLTEMLVDAGALPVAVDGLARVLLLLLLLDGALAAGGLTPYDRSALLARSVAADLLARELTPPPRGPA